MGKSNGPCGPELTKDLAFLGVPHDQWDELELEIKGITGVTFAKILRGGRLVVHASRQKTDPRITADTVFKQIEQLLETYATEPVGTTSRNLEGRRARSSRLTYVNNGWRVGIR